VQSYEWDLLESPTVFNDQPEERIWPKETDSEKEALTVLTQARTQADEIILEARVAADNILLQAQDEIDQEKKEGYQRGWDDARNEHTQALKAAHEMVEEVRHWRDWLMSQGEPILVEMLKEISQAMFGEGVQLDPSALQLNLNRVMEYAQKLGDLNIFLNRRDAELLDPSWGEYQLLITGNRVKIIPSEKIKPGGCIVKGSMGMVDARVETQLDAILHTIEETRGMKE
jgi:flagellar assembly protein FliH